MNHDIHVYFIYLYSLYIYIYSIYSVYIYSIYSLYIYIYVNILCNYVYIYIYTRIVYIYIYLPTCVSVCKYPPTPAFAKAGAAPGTTAGVELVLSDHCTRGTG